MRLLNTFTQALSFFPGFDSERSFALLFCSFYIQCFTASSALATLGPLKKSLVPDNGPGTNLLPSAFSLLVHTEWV